MLLAIPSMLPDWIGSIFKRSPADNDRSTYQPRSEAQLTGFSVLFLRCPSACCSGCATMPEALRSTPSPVAGNVSLNT
jgi:hypothetical protein